VELERSNGEIQRSPAQTRPRRRVTKCTPAQPSAVRGAASCAGGARRTSNDARRRVHFSLSINAATRRAAVECVRAEVPGAADVKNSQRREPRPAFTAAARATVANRVPVRPTLVRRASARRRRSRWRFERRVSDGAPLRRQFVDGAFSRRGSDRTNVGRARVTARASVPVSGGFVSGTHRTRLETRTKESSMCASHWDSMRNCVHSYTKPTGAMKVKDAARCRREDARTRLYVACRRIPEAFRKSAGFAPARLSRRTESAHAGTRKMVNYAWSGRSQGKP
jgi:hypothetical protein